MPRPARTPTPDPSPPPDQATEETPSPSPQESPEAAASSPGSSRASRTGSTGFTVDPGPAFDEDGRPEAEPGAEPAGATIHELPLAPDLWDERRVEQLLTAKGEILHGVVAVDRDSSEWRYTQADLRAIAPPLTAILNRYEPTRAAAHVGDELALVIGFGGYAARSIMERRHALHALAEQDPEPRSGVRAEPGTGPPEPGYEDPHIPDADREPAPIRPRR